MDLKKILKSIKLHEREISVFFGVVVLVVAGGFMIRYLGDVRTQSETQQANSNQNKAETYVISKGETLWSISQKYYKKGSDWKRIADANNISNPAELEVGKSLVIPDMESQIAPSSEPVEQVTPSPVPSPIPQITETAAATDSNITNDNYVVIKGDSLWKIAVRAYGDGSKWVKIARENNLKNPNLIHTGNVFRIPR